MKNALNVYPEGILQGAWCVPGDKSISHRALILGAISEGTTELQGFLTSEDCLATLHILQQCGVEITINAERVRIIGKGLTGLQPPSQPLNCQNSGTSLRLLAGLLSTQSFDSQLIGDASLSTRPMKRIVEPLKQMGAMVEGKSIAEEIYAPLTIKGGTSLQGIHYTLPVPSAQVKSCLLLAGLNAKGPTVIIEKESSRDHTEKLLAFFGANISRLDRTIAFQKNILGANELFEPALAGEFSGVDQNTFLKSYTQTTLNLGKAASERSPRNAHLVDDRGERVQPTQHKFKVGRVYICLKPGNKLIGRAITIAGDFSSAAFFIAGASFTPKSHLILRNVGVNSTRTGMIAILREMGADLCLQNEREISGELVADLEIKGGALQGIAIPREWIVSAIDEFPIIFVAAALAKGTTTIDGIGELRFKETDRIRVMVNALKTLGIKINEWEEGVSIEGGVLSGGVVNAKGDHRIAMALAIAGSRALAPIRVLEVDNIATSFPGFVALANQMGLRIE